LCRLVRVADRTRLGEKAAKSFPDLPKNGRFPLTSNSNFPPRNNSSRTEKAGAAQSANQEIKRMSLISRFLRDEAGATAIEYGLIAAGISVAIIGTVAGLGSKLNSTFNSVQSALN
jgi:pilus assembly protein Flp/PilA